MSTARYSTRRAALPSCAVIVSFQGTIQAVSWFPLLRPCLIVQSCLTFYHPIPSLRFHSLVSHCAGKADIRCISGAHKPVTGTVNRMSGSVRQKAESFFEIRFRHYQSQFLQAHVFIFFHDRKTFSKEAAALCILGWFLTASRKSWRKQVLAAQEDEKALGQVYLEMVFVDVANLPCSLLASFCSRRYWAASS